MTTMVSFDFKKIEGLVSYSGSYYQHKFNDDLLFRSYQLDAAKYIILITSESWKLVLDRDRTKHEICLTDHGNEESLFFTFSHYEQSYEFHEALRKFIFSMDTEGCYETIVSYKVTVDIRQYVDLYINDYLVKAEIPIENYVAKESFKDIKIYYERGKWRDE